MSKMHGSKGTWGALSARGYVPLFLRHRYMGYSAGQWASRPERACGHRFRCGVRPNVLIINHYGWLHWWGAGLGSDERERLVVTDVGNGKSEGPEHKSE